MKEKNDFLEIVNEYKKTVDMTKTNEELVEMIKSGDMDAQIELYLNNFRSIDFAARKVSSMLNNSALLDEDDFNIIGAIELLDSVRRFDPEKAKFGTFSKYCIYCAMKEEIRNKVYTIHIPAGKSDEMRNAVKMYHELKITHDRNECLKIISDKMRKKPEDVEELLKIYENIAVPDSLDYLMDEGILPKEEGMVEKAGFQKVLHEKLDEVLRTLTYQEELILRERFGMNDGVEKTQEEIGKMIGISTARVGQIEKRALNKLSNSRKCKQLKIFLD